MGSLRRSHIETDVFFTVAMDADYVIWDAESRLEERLAKVEKAIGRMADFEARLKWIDDREDVMEERQGIMDERLAATNVVHDNLDEWQGELNSRLSGLEDYLG